MIIEPVPTSPRSPRRRVAQLAGVVAPVALLALIIGGGLLGATGTPAGVAPGTGATAGDRGAAGDPLTTDPGSAAATRPPDGRPARSDGSTGFPTVVAGLPVHSVVDALATHDDHDPERLFAVAGYLGVLDPPADCEGGPLGPLGPVCERIGVLAQVPWSFSGGAAFAGLGPHLHPRFSIGMSLPAGISRTTSEARGAPIPVVVIGRFDIPPGDCSPDADPCDARFLADGVAWADGAPTRVRPMLDAGLDARPADLMLRNERVAEIAAIGWSGTILEIALVRPATVSSIDPSAGAALAAALAAASPPAGLVWYVRGLETGYGSVGYPFGHAPPRLTWVVVDDVTGAVLARSPLGQPAS